MKIIGALIVAAALMGCATQQDTVSAARASYASTQAKAEQMFAAWEPACRHHGQGTQAFAECMLGHFHHWAMLEDARLAQQRAAGQAAMLYGRDLMILGAPRRY